LAPSPPVARRSAYRLSRFPPQISHQLPFTLNRLRLTGRIPFPVILSEAKNL